MGLSVVRLVCQSVSCTVPAYGPSNACFLGYIPSSSCIRLRAHVPGDVQGGFLRCHPQILHLHHLCLDHCCPDHLGGLPLEGPFWLSTPWRTSSPWTSTSRRTFPWRSSSGWVISSMGTRLIRVLSVSRIIRIPCYVILSGGMVSCHLMKDCCSSTFTTKMMDNIRVSSRQICRAIRHSPSKSTPPRFRTCRCFSSNVKDVIFSLGVIGTPQDGCPSSTLTVGASPRLLALLG